MPMKIPFEGRKALTDSLRFMWNSFDPLLIRLFKGDYVPADGDTLATFAAIECDFGGYAALPLDGWADFGLDPDGREVVQCEAAEWVRLSGSNLVYGYFVCDLAGTTLVWAERFASAPFLVDAANEFFTFVPQFTLTSEF